jgi:hypothetical protein
MAYTLPCAEGTIPQNALNFLTKDGMKFPKNHHEIPFFVVFPTVFPARLTGESLELSSGYRFVRCPRADFPPFFYYGFVRTGPIPT